MGWQLINSMVKKDTGIDTDTRYSFGYLIGDGRESGYYCFTKSPFVNTPFISDTYLPKIKLNGSPISIYGLSYNDENTWGSENGGQWIFKPKTQGGKWISFGNLREPYYYTDIDDETVVGDTFYKGDLPQLNGEAEEWEIQGGYWPSQAGRVNRVELIQNLWTWHDNGDLGSSASGFCGKYYNEEDGTYKTVGIPTYATQSSNTSCYFNGEHFTRSFEKNSGSNHFDYIGDNGHTISYDRGNMVWTIGTKGRGKWSETGDAPSIHSPCVFKGYEIDQGTGEEVPDSKGDFTLSWQHMSLGNEKRQVYMGEVSLWRKALNLQP